MKKMLFALFVLLFPLVAYAQMPNAEDPIGMVKFLLDAFKSGNWNLVAAAVIMLLVWAINKLPSLANIPAAAKVWMSLGAGVAAAVVTNYFAGGNWVSAVISGLTTGAAASGLWSALGKKILNRK